MSYTLCAATPFIGEGLIPFERIGPAEKRIDIFNFTGERGRVERTGQGDVDGSNGQSGGGTNGLEDSYAVAREEACVW